MHVWIWFGFKKTCIWPGTLEVQRLVAVAAVGLAAAAGEDKIITRFDVV